MERWRVFKSPGKNMGRRRRHISSLPPDWAAGRREGLQVHPAPPGQVCSAHSPGWPAHTAAPWHGAQAAEQSQAVSMLDELWPSAILEWSPHLWSAQHLVSACLRLLSAPKALIFHASPLSSQPTRVSSAYLQDKLTFLIYHENKFHDELREGVLKI